MSWSLAASRTVRSASGPSTEGISTRYWAPSGKRFVESGSSPRSRPGRPREVRKFRVGRIGSSMSRLMFEIPNHIRQVVAWTVTSEYDPVNVTAVLAPSSGDLDGGEVSDGSHRARGEPCDRHPGAVPGAPDTVRARGDAAAGPAPHDRARAAHHAHRAAVPGAGVRPAHPVPARYPAVPARRGLRRAAPPCPPGARGGPPGRPR